MLQVSREHEHDLGALIAFCFDSLHSSSSTVIDAALELAVADRLARSLDQSCSKHPQLRCLELLHA